MALLVTGGTGFIGSHTVVSLLEAGHELVILDNLSNSSIEVLTLIEKITGIQPIFYQGDVRDIELLDRIFTTHTIQGVLHFAAKKAVGESCTDPWMYYDANILGLSILTQCMHRHGCKKIVFSSSCTVYDPLASEAPFDESSPTGNSFSPYGSTKYMNELLLRDLTMHQGFSVANLRYFNPIGAHSSGLIGENPAQTPTNILPVIMQVVQGSRPELSIYGDSYDTPDGTCLRDYIHVVDLAQAHCAAWLRLNQQSDSVREAINLGTGVATSVKELLAIVQKVTTQTIAHTIVAPRPGDVPVAYAQAQKAKDLLGRETRYSVEDAVRDARNYITNETIENKK